MGVEVRRGELQHAIAQRADLDGIFKTHETVASGQLVGNLVLRVSM